MSDQKRAVDGLKNPLRFIFLLFSFLGRGGGGQGIQGEWPEFID